MWECQKCHERHEDSFEVCWNCGTSKAGVEDSAFRAADQVDPASLDQVDPASLAQARSQQGEEIEPARTPVPGPMATSEAAFLYDNDAEHAGGRVRTAYEFTPEQNELIVSLAFNMKIVGIVSLIAGGLLTIAGLILLARGGVSALIQGVLALIIGGLTVQAAGAFRLIVDSQGDDIGHLMSALGALRSLYRLQVILLCFALALLILAFWLVASSGR